MLSTKSETTTNGDEMLTTKYESSIQRSPVEPMVIGVLRSLDDPPPI